MGIVFGFLVFLFSYFFLHQFNDPPGINGYFYLKQILSLASSNAFYFKDHSLAFAMPVVLAKLSVAELAAFRLSISAVLGCCAGLHWAFCQKLLAGRPRWQSYGVPVVMVGLSYPLIELGFGFFKNMTAVVLVLWTLYLLYRGSDAVDWKWVWKPALTASLAFLCHKSATLLILLAAFAFLVEKRKYKALVIFAAGGAVLLALFSVVFSQGGAYLGYLMSTVGFRPEDFLKWSRELIRDDNLIYLTLVQALAFWAAVLMVWRRMDSARRFLSLFLVLLALVTWLPIYEPGQDEASYRMMLVFGALAPVLMTAVLLEFPSTVIAAGVIAGVQIAQFSLSRPMFNLISNYDRFSAQVGEINKFVNAEDHLICHHGLEFYVDYKTGIRCQIFLSEDPAQKQFRMVYAPPTTQWLGIRVRVKELALMEMGSTYLLVKEDDWVKLSLTEKMKDHWRNPARHRPEHIYAP